MQKLTFIKNRSDFIGINRLSRLIKFIKGKLESAAILYLILILCVLLLFLFLTIEKYISVVNVRMQTLAQLRYWKNVIKMHPNYTDAYYEAAVYDARLGQTTEAILEINHMLELDPGSQIAQHLKGEIEKL